MKTKASNFLLMNCDTEQVLPPCADFHDLSFRYREQYWFCNALVWKATLL